MKGWLLILATLTVANLSLAADWPTWRGPNYDGSTTETGLPTEFGPDKAVKWSIDLPGTGASTPIIVGDRVFLTAANEDKQELLAICVDRKTGKIAWQQQAGSGYQAGGAGTKVKLSSRSNYASPSAVSDGKLVTFFYGNGDLVCYDVDGKLQWRKNLQQEYGDFTFQWTFSSTPMLWDGTLYMQILQRDTPVHGRGKNGNESFLVAFEHATGKEVWKELRPSPAQKESLEAYGTPIPYVENGRKELLILGGDILTGHDPATGKELWRWGTWNPGHRQQWWRVVPSAVVGDGIILACGPKGCPVHAIKTGLSGKHAGDSGLAWIAEGRKTALSSDVPTPCFYKGHFYVASDVRKALSKVDPKTGKVLWTVDLPGNYKYRSSPTGADDRIWMMNHNGTVFTFSADDGKLLHEAAFGGANDDFIRSSLAVAHGAVFVRTNNKLFCLSAK